MNPNCAQIHCHLMQNQTYKGCLSVSNHHNLGFSFRETALNNCRFCDLFQKKRNEMTLFKILKEKLQPEYTKETFTQQITSLGLEFLLFVFVFFFFFF